MEETNRGEINTNKIESKYRIDIKNKDKKLSF